MASLDWSQCPVVEKTSGGSVFRGTRTPVSALFENLKAGASINEIVKKFEISREQVDTVLEFAARSLDVASPTQQTGEHAASAKVHGDKLDTAASGKSR